VKPTKCRQNFLNRCRLAGSKIRWDLTEPDTKPIDFELGRSSMFYREQYHGGMQ